MCGRAKASFPATLPTQPMTAAYLVTLYFPPYDVGFEELAVFHSVDYHPNFVVTHSFRFHVNDSRPDWAPGTR